MTFNGPEWLTTGLGHWMTLTYIDYVLSPQSMSINVTLRFNMISLWEWLGYVWFVRSCGICHCSEYLDALAWCPNIHISYGFIQYNSANSVSHSIRQYDTDSWSQWSTIQPYKHTWLVGWNIWITFPCIGNFIIPIDELILFRGGRSTTNQNISYYIMISKFGYSVPTCCS